MGTLPPGLIQKDEVEAEKQTFILPFQLNEKNTNVFCDHQSNRLILKKGNFLKFFVPAMKLKIRIRFFFPRLPCSFLGW